MKAKMPKMPKSGHAPMHKVMMESAKKGASSSKLKKSKKRGY